jgi:hypothetical protein
MLERWNGAWTRSIWLRKGKGEDGKIILKWIFKRLDEGAGYGQVMSSCECGDEPLGSVKCG